MSLQVVICLCRRKETAAFLKPPFSFGRDYCLLDDGFFSFAVVRQVQSYLLLMSRISISLGDLSVVNRIIEGLVQFFVRCIIADVDGLAILLGNIDALFRYHILGWRDHGVGVSLAFIFGI